MKKQKESEKLDFGKAISVLAEQIVAAFLNGIITIIKTLLECALAFDKRLKRYTGIETPLYKYWWKIHSNNMQKKLDKLHNTRYAKY